MSTDTPARGLAGSVDPDGVERVVAASRVVGALVAASTARLDPPLTTSQWRVLVMAADGPCNVSAVATDLGVHMSNATRTCDQLVRRGLLERRRSDEDRRHKLLALTPAGRRVYEEAMDFRRQRLADAMERMKPRDRAALARTLELLVAAMGQTRQRPP